MADSEHRNGGLSAEKALRLFATSPINILREAIKAVPPLKWALGVLGVVAAIAIVVVSFRISLSVAVFGTLIMLILMVLLVVFAALTRASGALRIAAIIMMFAFLALGIATATCIFTSVFFKWPLDLQSWVTGPNPPPPVPTPTPTPTPTPSVSLSGTPSRAVNTGCRRRESGAIIDGTPVPLSAWRSDCSYNGVLNNQMVRLTTWGIILEFAGATIVSARIIPPNVDVRTPTNSVLQAGFVNRESAEVAYSGSNPNGPTPSGP